MPDRNRRRKGAKPRRVVCRRCQRTLRAGAWAIVTRRGTLVCLRCLFRVVPIDKIKLPAQIEAELDEADAAGYADGLAVGRAEGGTR